MFGSILFAALALCAAADPVVTPIEGGRFRVAIVYSDMGASGHVQAQIALMRTAAKVCRGKGEAVSDGELTVNRAAPAPRGRKALEISEIFTCVAKASPRR